MTEKQGKRGRDGEIDRYGERERDRGKRERDSGREIEREKDEG